MIVYLIAAAVAVGALGGLYWKIDRNGYSRGQAEMKADWDAANAAAQQKADADRKRQEAARAKEDEDASKRLRAAQKRARTIYASLEAHIRAAGSATNCAIPDSLRDDWNNANAGGEGHRTGTVPGSGRSAPPAH